MRVGLLDYEVGNLHSLRKALERAGATVDVVRDADALLAADAVVLPGVGAFGDAARLLEPLRAPLNAALEEGKPLLGVCLGMQLLFEDSEESPGVPGLGYCKGAVKRLKHRVVPQIGWNVLAHNGEDPVFDGIPEGTHVYYVNSYACNPRESVTTATTSYGSHTYTAAVRKRNVVGMQFHPEKSSKTGLRMIDNWVRQAEREVRA